MTEPTDVRELRERLRKDAQDLARWKENTPPSHTMGVESLIQDLSSADAALERLEKLEALRSRLQMFLAAVGASTPDDHPWVVEARALANALRTCELATPAPAPQALRTPSVGEVEGEELAIAIRVLEDHDMLEEVDKLRHRAASAPQQGETDD